jgi:hypothetical protein
MIGRLLFPPPLPFEDAEAESEPCVSAAATAVAPDEEDESLSDPEPLLAEVEDTRKVDVGKSSEAESEGWEVGVDVKPVLVGEPESSVALARVDATPDASASDAEEAAASNDEAAAALAADATEPMADVTWVYTS